MKDAVNGTYSCRFGQRQATLVNGVLKERITDVTTGPGIGSATAKKFAATGSFSKIVMVSRNEERLQKESESVQKAAASNVEVVSMPCDLSDLSALKKVLGEIESLDPLGGIFFNAARIHIVDPLSAPVMELDEDFRVNCSPGKKKAMNTDPII